MFMVHVQKEHQKVSLLAREPSYVEMEMDDWWLLLDEPKLPTPQQGSECVLNIKRAIPVISYNGCFS